MQEPQRPGGSHTGLDGKNLYLLRERSPFNVTTMAMARGGLSCDLKGVLSSPDASQDNDSEVARPLNLGQGRTQGLG